MIKSKETYVGSKNIRMLSVLIADVKSRIEYVHGELDMIITKIGL